MRISELAKIGLEFGIDKRTIDYYTNKGLIPCPDDQKEPSSGYRDYGEDAVAALKKIAILREVGMSVKDIKAALKDPSYFSTAMWDDHIARLEEERAKTNERFNKMIDYAKALRDSKSHILKIVDQISSIETGYILSKVLSVLVNAINNIIQKRDEFMEQSDDKPDDVAVLYLRIDRLFDTLIKCFDRGVPYDSEQVQNALSKFFDSLMDSFGIVVYSVYDAFKDSDKGMFGAFDKISEDEYQLFMKGLSICMTWYKKARTIEKALDFDQFYEQCKDQIHEYDTLVGESTFDDLTYLVTEISKIPRFVAGIVAESFKNEDGKESFVRGYDAGYETGDSLVEMTSEQQELSNQFGEYLKNAFFHFLAKKVEEVPENWFDEFDTDDDEEEGD